MYRVIGVLEKTAKAIEHRVVPAVASAKASWKRAVLWTDGAIVGGLVLAFLAWTISAGYWTGFQFSATWFTYIVSNTWLLALVAVVAAAGAGYLHFLARKLSARFIARRIARNPELDGVREWTARAFVHNTKAWRTIMAPSPAGWGRSARRLIAQVVADADGFVQRLNDRFTDPSGGEGAKTDSAQDLLGHEEPEPSAGEAPAIPVPVPAGSERT